MFLALGANIKELSVVPPGGMSADLGNFAKRPEAEGYVAEVGTPLLTELDVECLKGCNLVLILGGMPRKFGQTRDDLFEVNACIAEGLVEVCGNHCPDAILVLIFNSVNSMLLALAELYKKKTLDPMRVAGVTTLDCRKSSTFRQCASHWWTRKLHNYARRFTG